MITILPQPNGIYKVFNSGMPTGIITASYNRYHAKNVYLHIELEQYDTAAAGELFGQLKKMIGSNLQVMLDSCHTQQAAFLAASGFKRVRRCYEMQVSASDLKTSISRNIPLKKAIADSPEYRCCRKMLFNSYSKSHEKISPLTASPREFYAVLPKTIVFYSQNRQITHWAFTEANEIAYVGTDKPQEFHAFAEALLSYMLAEFKSIFFECDDCDPISMELKSFFDPTDVAYCDTYILVQ